MKMETISFDVEGFGGGVQSSRRGDIIVIDYASWPVMSFDIRDLDARDWTIAALLETPLKGKTIAELCHTRPSQVSKVKQRIKLGGYKALLRKRPGRKAELVGPRFQLALKLRRQGLTMRQIADELGLSVGCVSKHLKGIPADGEPEQQELEGLDGCSLEPQKAEAGDEPVGTEISSEREETGDDEVSDEDQEMAVEVVVEALAEAEQDLAEETEVVEGACPPAIDEPSASASEGVCPPPVDEPSASASEGVCLPPVDEPSASASEETRELVPGEPLPVGPAEHPCRYAGTLLIAAAVQALGLTRALVKAGVRRPKESVYDAWQAIVALMTAWASGLGSLEAMHERDARALGVVLGLERSPSVRTLHRAIAQMVAAFNPIKLCAALLRGLIAAVGRVPRIFGVDGHFKPYFGKEPIDKGYDTKRRMGHRGLQDVLIHDEEGRIFAGLQVGAGDRLSEHLLSSAELLRGAADDGQDVVLGFDRGGFCLADLDALDADGIFYVGWVPATVKLPDLATVAPKEDGVGERRFKHKEFRDEHNARLLVVRDGEALLPVLTNLSESVSASDALKMLRRVRGVQENDIKAARAFAHIDRLADRGGARRGPDDRQVDNPEHLDLSNQRRKVRSRLNELSKSEPISSKDHARRAGEQLLAGCQEAVLNYKLNELPAKVPRVELEPDAERAWLKTKNRSLLQPLKYVLANGRRWLLSVLGSSLAPSDEKWDQSAVSRTLAALIRAPGTVRFEKDGVVVTLELPLPPQPHARLAQGLLDLDGQVLLFTDGRRQVRFRLAPRPTRQDLPSASLR